MPFETALTRRLGLAHPLVQAPMAGGPTTVELVAACSEAGALGSIAAAYSSPGQIAEACHAVRRLTDRPFAVNLFAPRDQPMPDVDPAAAVRAVAGYHRELGLAPPETPEWRGEPFPEQFSAVLECRPAAFSFTFGPIPADSVARARELGIFLIGTATTVREAAALEALGVDAVVAQGAEAGAHRGTFAADIDGPQLGTVALVAQVAGAVDLPVIAAGGIMDGRGIAAVLALGAQAAQLGTAFLTCPEAGTAPAYRAALLAGEGEATRMTRAFSGREARGLRNRFIDEVEALGREAILPFPLQNDLTRPLRQAAGASGRQEFLSLWAGQGVGMSRELKAGDLVATLARELEAAVERLRPA